MERKETKLNYTIYEKSTNDHERIAFNEFKVVRDTTITNYFFTCWFGYNKTILIETGKNMLKNNY